MKKVCITISANTFSLYEVVPMFESFIFSLCYVFCVGTLLLGTKIRLHNTTTLKPYFVNFKIVSLVHIFRCHISDTNLPRPKTEGTTIHCKDNTLRKAIGKPIQLSLFQVRSGIHKQTEFFNLKYFKIKLFFLTNI